GGHRRAAGAGATGRPAGADPVEAGARGARPPRRRQQGAADRRSAQREPGDREDALREHLREARRQRSRGGSRPRASYRVDPVTPLKKVREALERRSSHMNVGHSTENAAASDTRILIVDDDEQMVRLLGSIVTDAGYAWSGARTGMEARASLGEDRFALLLVDVNMPGES